MKNYSILVGENNAGKTNIITAIRMFYADDKLKFDNVRDLPKYETDNESWIELSFLLSNEEIEDFKDHVLLGNIIKVRKYFQCDNTIYKLNTIYAYDKSDKLSGNKIDIYDIEKFGGIIFIPDINVSDEVLKLSGPSPFRRIIESIIIPIIANSDAYTNLKNSFKKFNNEFKDEEISGNSINTFIGQVNEKIKQWNSSVNINIKEVVTDDIIKSLLRLTVKDNGLGKDIDIDSFGQGFQRSLIYTIINLASEYMKSMPDKKNNKVSEFKLLLFEEPESFLHPSQQIILNLSLRKLAGDILHEEDNLYEEQTSDNNPQILIATHSPIFVSKNIENLDAIIKINKKNNQSCVFQLKKSDIQKLTEKNLESKKTETSDKDNIDWDCEFKKASMEYFLWLNSERASSFFAKHVIICEGATEKILFDYIMSAYMSCLIEKQIYVLDAGGKYNIHKYMNLFGSLGITHSIVFDHDNNKTDKHKQINDYLEKNKNDATKEIHGFDADLEDFLGIDTPKDRYMKPLNAMKNLRDGKISPEKLNELKELLEKLSQY